MMYAFEKRAGRINPFQSSLLKEWHKAPFRVSAMRAVDTEVSSLSSLLRIMGGDEYSSGMAAALLDSRAPGRGHHHWRRQPQPPDRDATTSMIIVDRLTLFLVCTDDDRLRRVQAHQCYRSIDNDECLVRYCNDTVK